MIVESSPIVDLASEYFQRCQRAKMVYMMAYSWTASQRQFYKALGDSKSYEKCIASFIEHFGLSEDEWNLNTIKQEVLRLEKEWKL